MVAVFSWHLFETKQGQVVDLQILRQISRERKPTDGIDALIFLGVITVNKKNSLWTP